LSPNNDKFLDTYRLAKYIRVKSLIMVSAAKSSHIGSCLSAADLIAVIQTLVNDSDDELVFSKGHAAAAIYASLAGLKKIPEDSLNEFGTNGSNLIGHVNHLINGISFSTGSLGHGFPLGVGVAIASKQKQVYIIISDGELNEGTTWESLAIAKQLNLSNLTLIVDVNGIQSFGKTNEVVNFEPMVDKFVSFGWHCIEVDGHSIPLIFEALAFNSNFKPKVIIAHTIKGKGVAEMEGKLDWHYKSPKEEDLESFLNEVSDNA
jgi:transketolase